MDPCGVMATIGTTTVFGAGKEDVPGDTSGLKVAVDRGSSAKPREPLLHLPHVVGPEEGEAVELVVFLHLLGVLDESREVVVGATDFVRGQGMVLKEAILRLKIVEIMYRGIFRVFKLRNGSFWPTPQSQNELD